MGLSLIFTLFVYRNRSITLTSQNKVCLRFTAKNLYANELLINVWTDSRKKSPRKKQAQKCLKQIFKVKEWKMVNFKLGEQMWRWNSDEIISMSRAWDKEKIWLLDIWFEPMTSKTRGGRSTTELRRTQGERGHILGSYLTRVLHAARISNVEVLPLWWMNERR